MKKLLFGVLSIVLVLFIARPSWAIVITHLEGEIYAEVGTDYAGGPFSDNTSGWEASGGVDTPTAIENAANAHASGYKINGPLNNDNHARFILQSTAQSAAKLADNSFTTYALVRSGEGLNDKLEFELTPEPGEEGMDIELTAEAVLAGTLNSGGLSMVSSLFEFGIAELSFTFEIYKDPTKLPVMSFIYSDPRNPYQGDGIDDTTGEPTQLETYSIAGSLGKSVDNTTFKTGDHLYVFFEQLTTATVDGDFETAQGYAVQSTNDVITIAIDAQTIPEPSLIILLGSLIISVGFIERKRFRG